MSAGSRTIRMNPNNRDPVGDPEGVIYHPDYITEHASAVLLGKEVARILTATYPGWQWQLSVDPRGGVIHIREAFLSRTGYAYVINMATSGVQDSPGALRRLVIEGGGELLARFRIKPGPYSLDAFLGVPRDRFGDPVPDLSDKPKAVRRKERDRMFASAVKHGHAKAIDDKDTHTRHIIIKN